jgi:hypothetical protein
MLHPRLAKPESIANAQSEIQIVDTRFSCKTRISTGFTAGTPQLNRTPLTKTTTKTHAQRSRQRGPPNFGDQQTWQSAIPAMRVNRR